MITSDYTVRVLEPSEGHYLTQSGDININERVFSDKVYLAVTDSVENWIEIDQAKYEEYQQELIAYNENNEQKDE